MLIETDRGVVDTNKIARMDIQGPRIVFRKSENGSSVLVVAGIINFESEAAAEKAYEEIMLKS